MSRIKGRDTKPEMALRKELWKRGLRYRVHYKIKGKPDIVFVSKRIAIFVDGCFWHGCPIHGVRPKTNAEFWDCKIGSNIARDQKNKSDLEEQGWIVLRFWEHEISNDLPAVVSHIVDVVSENSGAGKLPK